MVFCAIAKREAAQGIVADILVAQLPYKQRSSGYGNIPLQDCLWQLRRKIVAKSPTAIIFLLTDREAKEMMAVAPKKF